MAGADTLSAENSSVEHGSDVRELNALTEMSHALSGVMSL